jgi:hypothetical protein
VYGPPDPQTHAGGIQPDQMGGAQPNVQQPVPEGQQAQPGGAPPTGQGYGNQGQSAPYGFGTLGFVNPAYVNPAQNPAYMQQYEQLVAQGLAPQFAQQQQQLQDSSAARGISSSGAAGYLQSDLLGQQAAAYAQGISPIVQQGYGYNQQDIMANQGAANQASYYNAGTYNNYLNALQTAYLNSYGPNTGVTNAYGQAVGGIGSTVGGVYGSALGAEGQALGAAGTAFGYGAGGGGGG